eukprot:CAMPEP_0198200906 /NCGR_PEP_ID=MMETSP1445-20131203/3797_1 /TAXON_ID=36898 /ORGANISM="Pyramimonas sp., Strain CCMP2087" /LENGTH=223 /DNA_ID=CAMNT_0043871073 /DNA_START=208 /DNA_END=879 /DNA_ORIENTATION=-
MPSTPLSMRSMPYMPSTPVFSRSQTSGKANEGRKEEGGASLSGAKRERTQPSRNDAQDDAQSHTRVGQRKSLRAQFQSVASGNDKAQDDAQKEALEQPGQAYSSQLECGSPKTPKPVRRSRPSTSSPITHTARRLPLLSPLSPLSASTPPRAPKTREPPPYEALSPLARLLRSPRPAVSLGPPKQPRGPIARVLADIGTIQIATNHEMIHKAENAEPERILHK